uniref:Phosphatidylinositol-glycan biosynthesis class W protein n=1 Tax=Lepisosteus oculatus TaxID=7918 RepID=W5NLM0_LEPOC|nr:PREDICTED: phosphatidylinositol-glycan biosynthesis class W protein [Lepisosteus oculatus]XP_015223119.1 PREDICTED: phosphatidylinositol-glycan biosynthesis class W protein [Lepisosteus oculatus]XP_015223120.1 PREDICTED: phosphatidylinositol-glycan biosynthesis class W protein [Lepisosteus oculatus]
MSQKEIKEAFVSNLNGTTLGEISLGSALAPLCLLSRGLGLILYFLGKGVFPFPWKVHLLLDFTVVVLPLILSCTVLSDALHVVIVSLAAFDASMLFRVYHRRKHSPAVPFRRTFKDFLGSSLETDRVPFVTVFRVLVNVKTAISILAVDFAIFPRRYAKSETYGTGVMDFGVGAFILANSLVCPEARRKQPPPSKFAHLTKQLLSVWPLVALGLARLLSVKATGYHEHVSEYGVHWNFFFTLAIVRAVASLLLSVFPVNRSWLLAVIIGGSYQAALELTDLKSFILNGSDRTGGFVSANREGVFSVIGYVAIYMAGVQVGLHVMESRMVVKDWIKAIARLLLGSFALWAVLFVCQMFVEPVSRRMANLSFGIWTVAQSLYFLCCLSAADLVLAFAKFLSNCRSVSSSWSPSQAPQTQNSDSKSSSVDRKIREDIEGLCLIQAVNRNQLLFFMLSNIMTGLTNVMVDTIHSSSVFSVFVLVFYMFANSFIVYVLHLQRITVKFW